MPACCPPNVAMTADQDTSVLHPKAALHVTPELARHQRELLEDDDG